MCPAVFVRKQKETLKLFSAKHPYISASAWFIQRQYEGKCYLSCFFLLMAPLPQSPQNLLLNVEAPLLLLILWRLSEKEGYVRGYLCMKP